MQKAIQSAFVAGGREHPTLEHLTLDDYAKHVQRLNATVRDLERNGSDLFLALACGRGDGAAIQALEQNHRSGVEAQLLRSGFDAPTRQDVFQQLLLHLCTGDYPRILTYAGKASLASWLRVVALRFAINMTPRVRVRSSDATELALSHLAADDRNPELRLAIEGARPLFQTALARAMSNLSDRQVTILRLFFVEGITNEEIGKLYGVHRATSARWIAEIRERIREDVRDILAIDFGLRESEFESLALLIRSELHLSLKRILGVA